MKANLKKLTSTLVLVLFVSLTTYAQRIAIVDVNKILESIEEYQNAQTQLDNLAAQWQQEISQEHDVIKGMYNKYQAEQVLLSDEARRQREDAILAKEKEVRDLQRARFGPEGELFKRRQGLVRPIQDRVYSAIESYAQDRGYDFIFDKSSASGMIFSNSEYDKTNDILNKLK